MRLDHKHCRVWEAPGSVRDLLPPVHQVPKHPDHADSIYTVYDEKRKLDYVTCVTGEWHTDWPITFTYLVARGCGTLYLAQEMKEQSSLWPDLYEGCRSVARCAIKRGDIIQLWPMAAHRVRVNTTMALIEIEKTPQPSERVGFSSKYPFAEPRHAEQAFGEVLRAAQRRYRRHHAT